MQVVPLEFHQEILWMELACCLEVVDKVVNPILRECILHSSCSLIIFHWLSNTSTHKVKLTLDSLYDVILISRVPFLFESQLEQSNDEYI
jgi:hypothetical protein